MVTLVGVAESMLGSDHETFVSVCDIVPAVAEPEVIVQPGAAIAVYERFVAAGTTSRSASLAPPRAPSSR